MTQDITMNKKTNYNGVVYILTMTIAFTTRYGDISLGWHHQIFIGAFWIAFALLQMAKNRFKYKENKEIIFFLKLYLIPHLVIHLYTIFLMAIGKVNWSYFSTNVTVYVPTTLAIMSIYLFKNKAIVYNLIALILSWSLSVTVSTIWKGPAIFVHAILQAYVNPLDDFGGLTLNYLELHDLVLAVGYIIVFYIFLNSKFTKKSFTYVAIMIIIMTLGMKRISLVGLALAIIVNLLIKRERENKQYRFCLLAGSVGFLLCYAWIYVFSSSEIYALLSSHGINMMGRQYYYSTILKYSEFSPTFIGIGRNVVTKILQGELSYMRVEGVHSDIIKMYVEVGFIMFGLWLWYLLIHMTKEYKKVFGNKAAVVYFGVLIYTFSLYLTDNVETYFISQLISIVLPATYAMYGNSSFRKWRIESYDN